MCVREFDPNNWYQSKGDSTRSLKMDSSKLGIEKFDESDFSFWKIQIKDYLYQKDLHEPFTRVKPESMTEEKWKLKDR